VENGKAHPREKGSNAPEEECKDDDLFPAEKIPDNTGNRSTYSDTKDKYRGNHPQLSVGKSQIGLNQGQYNIENLPVGLVKEKSDPQPDQKFPLRKICSPHFVIQFNQASQ
jgi:hypothetical protein